MPKVAAAFGKVLGPKGRMPNPKAGCVVPPNANLEPLVKKLQNTVRIKVNTGYLFQTRIGKEDTPDEHLIDNSMAIYNALIHALPGEQHNIKNVYLKLTMGPAIKVGAKEITPTEEVTTKKKIPVKKVKEEPKKEEKHKVAEKKEKPAKPKE